MKQEIKGFPDYYYDTDTGNVVSRLRRHTVLKWGVKYMQDTPMVQVQNQDGKRRTLNRYRLLYCLEHGIGYYDIPDGIRITRNGVTDNRGLMEQAKSVQRERFKDGRIERIDMKMHELEIIRRAYVEGSTREVVEHIEGKRFLLIDRYRKKYRTSWQKSELVFNMALQRIVDRMECSTSCVTELTCSMMNYMTRVGNELKKESPLFLPSETTSNSFTRKP